MNSIIHFLLFLLVRALHFSFRYDFKNRFILEKAKKLSTHNNYIFAIWHQNLVTGITAHFSDGYVVIVSPSKDGEFVAKVCERLGLTVARGSSSRGGKQALAEMVEKMSRGLPAAITVDGPKGPAKIPKFGIIEISKLTGAPIVPMYARASKNWIFEKSWDRFHFPRPFSKVIIKYGEPLIVPRELEKDQYQSLSEKLRDALLELEDKK